MIYDEYTTVLRNALDALSRLGLKVEFKGNEDHGIAVIKRGQSVKTGQLKLVIE
jgi:hypothetical protein